MSRKIQKGEDGLSIQLTEKDLQEIVGRVIENVEEALEKEKQPTVKSKVKPIEMKISDTLYAPSVQSNIGNFGVFENTVDAINAGYHAQLDYMKNYQLKDRERILSAIRSAVIKEKQYLAKIVLEETKIGRLEDKVSKHVLVAQQTPGTEELNTESFSGDDGITLVEYAPFGLIGAVTPVTNPTETIINNTIGMLASGNAVVFNVHPSSKKASAFVVTLINKAIKEAGGPANLVTMIKNPTLETVKELTESSKIKLVVGTGGRGLVKTLLQSGKKTIGAGAGNPPVVVDETADRKQAAKSIITGASFDNNLLCIAEKEVFVVDSVADDLIYHFLDQGAYMLDQDQLLKLMDFSLEENAEQQATGCTLDNKRKYHVAKQWIGQDAQLFLEKLGVNKPEVNLLICEVDAEHPFVQLEQMMPVLPIVRVKNVDEAIRLAVDAEHGNKHTAVMHSKNIDNITRFAKEIGTTIFVTNQSSLAGVGFGGEGHSTMTIAGPTGEGITSAKTFTRQRRFVLGDGGLRIIG